MIDLFNGARTDEDGEQIFNDVFMSDEDIAVIPTAEDRVEVTNQALDTWGVHGTVKLIDRHGKIWVRLDGYGLRQYLPFNVGDLTVRNDPSPLVYPCEETVNPYVPQQNCPP